MSIGPKKRAVAMRIRPMHVDGIAFWFPAMIGKQNRDGISTIGLPLGARFSLFGNHADFLYVVQHGLLTCTPLNASSEIDEVVIDEPVFFQPGDLIDARVFADIPLEMKAVMWTELSRLKFSDLSTGAVRSLRRKALAEIPDQRDAVRAIRSSKRIVQSFESDHPPQPRPELRKLQKNTLSPLARGMLRDPIVRLVMTNDGFIGADILDVTVFSGNDDSHS